MIPLTRTRLPLKDVRIYQAASYCTCFLSLKSTDRRLRFQMPLAHSCGSGSFQYYLHQGLAKARRATTLISPILLRVPQLETSIRHQISAADEHCDFPSSRSAPSLKTPMLSHTGDEYLPAVLRHVQVCVRHAVRRAVAAHHAGGRAAANRYSRSLELHAPR